MAYEDENDQGNEELPIAISLGLGDVSLSDAEIQELQNALVRAAVERITALKNAEPQDLFARFRRFRRFRRFQRGG